MKHAIFSNMLGGLKKGILAPKIWILKGLSPPQTIFDIFLKYDFRNQRENRI